MTTAIQILDEMIKELIPKSSFGTSTLDSYKMQALQEAKSRIQALGDGWIPAITNPKLPANLIVKSYVYPTLVVEVNTLEEFHNMLPSIYMYLPPTK